MSNKLEKRIEDKVRLEQESRCVLAARDIFRLIGDNSDVLPMGDNVSAEDQQKKMVPIVDQIAQILINRGIKARGEISLVQQYMQQPTSEWSWRINEYIEGFKRALVEREVGIAYDDMTVSDLSNTILSKFGKKSTGEAIEEVK